VADADAVAEDICLTAAPRQNLFERLGAVFDFQIPLRGFSPLPTPYSPFASPFASRVGEPILGVAAKAARVIAPSA
jgi:hypothetical protein